MRALAFLALVLSAHAAAACDQPVCLADPERLGLTRIITFDDTRAGHGPGHQITELLVLDGAVFGAYFAGQSLVPLGNHDSVSGMPTAPLTVLPGPRRQNLSVVFFNGNNVLTGYGVAGFPKREAQGEGAIAFLFDEDQAALAFQIRGGEAGAVRALFLARDGTVIAELSLPDPGEQHYGFLRSGGLADIAGVVITNTDPQGLALDNVRFEPARDLS